MVTNTNSKGVKTTHPPRVCNDMYICTFNYLNLGLRGSGGIADFMYNVSLYHHGVKNYIKWIFDVSFYFLITMMCMNIVFGIIIDTFTEIREK